MAVTRANLSSLLAPGLKKVFWLAYRQYAEEHARIFNVGTSEHQYEDFQGIYALGTMPEKSEGVSVTYDVVGEAYKKRMTHTGYALAVRITREMHDDDLYGVINKMTQALARSARYTVEQQAANVFNNGFTTVTTGDALSLFNTAHLLANSSSTYANRPSTDADLSVASLQAGMIQFTKQVDDRNMLLAIQPRVLLVHVNDMFVAQEILRSKQKPFTADNEINVLEGALDLQINHYLTDTDAFFILSAKQEHELHFLWRTRIADQASDDFDTGDMKFKVGCRFSVAAPDWRGTYGSRGA